MEAITLDDGSLMQLLYSVQMQQKRTHLSMKCVRFIAVVKIWKLLQKPSGNRRYL